MDASRHGNFRVATLLSVIFLGLAIAGCDGDDGDDGAPGAAGPPGEDGAAGLACWDLNENGVPDLPDEDLNGDGVVNVNDCNGLVGGNQTPAIGNGEDLTEEEIAEIGRLVATIDSVDIASPPVVSFTVTDSKGNPAVGLSEEVTWFTAAKLVPGDPSFNGGLSYWQSYVNRYETADGEAPDVLEQALQATTDNFRSGGTLVATAPGKYEYTFGTDITDPEQTLGIEYEPSLTTRFGLEIRLEGAAEGPLAPLNPVYDFVPDGSAGSGEKNIADTADCASCHYQFDLHGGPRKTVEYCVTCHNPGTIDQDTGESVDLAYLAHSIHGGGIARERGGDAEAYPYIIYGFGESEHDYSDTTYPQTNTYCENCHEESEATPEGNAWNEGATAKTCGGCHADGLLAQNPDPVTGIPTYAFDHANADTNIGVAADGICGSCHLGAIPTAGTALQIHSAIFEDDRLREEAGEEFIFEIASATNWGPGETPVVVFGVRKPDGSYYDIVNDPEFEDANGAGLNLYVAWTTDDVYNGDENGNNASLRDRGNGPEPYSPAHPYRVYLDALKADAVPTGDGRYEYTFFAPLPTDISGDVMFALGSHPAALVTVRGGSEDPALDGTEQWQEISPDSIVFYPGTPREYRANNDGCNACHQQLQLHGGNRNGNTEMCLICHNNDQAGERGGATAGWGMAYMVHNIHVGNPDWWTGEFAEITYPQFIGNCFACHDDGTYNVARTTARAVSTGEDDTGLDDTWLNDISTTANAAVCGVCHSDSAAIGHFATNGGQVGVEKQNVVGVVNGVGIPTGQEACAVCHGAGSTFDTALYHATKE